MKHNLSLLALLLAAPLAHAQTSEKSLGDLYFSGPNPKLSAQERQALAYSQQWRSASSTGLQPTAGQDGTIRFLYGTQQPSIICAVLQVCDVELQPGEQVNSIHLGDTARWLVEPAITGNGQSEIQHLIIKPMDVGLETSLIVTTNRRTYHFRLRSHRTEFMSRVAFTYTEDAAAKWVAIKSKEQQDQKERKARTIPQTGEILDNLHFNYSIAGNAPWKPVRVYNNGTKTIIQMPSTMAQTEAPALLVIRNDGGIFSDAETVMVNYRIHGDRYIVDTIFDKAILIAGVGRFQDKITITRGE
jgi:type IV secretion system protein VirB9